MKVNGYCTSNPLAPHGFDRNASHNAGQYVCTCETWEPEMNTENNIVLKRTYLTMQVSDGSTWGVPVEMIARNRATHYAHEFGGDIERSLAEDTIPLFNESDYDIQDWAVNNMNWSDFTGHQVKLLEGTGIDFEEAWMECEKGLQ